MHHRRHRSPLHRPLSLALAFFALLVGGCATRGPTDVDGPPLRTPSGPEAPPPPDVMQVPDARPALEPIRPGGPNKPYAVLGETFTPLPPDAPLMEEGLASWYGRKFHGRRTANGEVYDMYAMTAAHRTLPLPSFARIHNPANGRSVLVRVNDRGPFIKGRIVDLSYAAAQRLGVRGLAQVQLLRITPDEIRRGTWQGADAESGARATVIEGDDPPALASRPSATPDATAPTGIDAAPARGLWIQLGAFRDRAAAQALQQRAAEAFDGLSTMLAVFDEGGLYRVQAGPFAQRDEAQRSVDALRSRLRLAPVLVERSARR